ncbi:FBP domain-containing protein [Mobilicoccus massiliensis]|uniref:FBP domain-containing protein n=1 Tax=Mobilicoccus massiliensis TaxID=1522310 RepID=UPI00058E46C8|nr:FBP domain-containing protein [Mobilicoccus massiliensis]
MQPITEQQIRSSFVNASKGEANRATIPELDHLDWGSLDYLGWTDAKRPGISYVVMHVDGTVRGILLRAAGSGAPTNRKAICVWCEDVKATDNVRMVIAPLAGKAGRDGGTIGTLACAGFACSSNVRRAPSRSEIGDQATAEEREFWTGLRIEGLRERVARFIHQVMRDD